jgi:uncharacterized damage-inducible protein DinB
MNLHEAFIAATIDAFEANKKLADRAIAQLSDEQLRTPLDRNTNSIAVIMKHVAGNLLSRWTDFLTTDGEKPNRNRDDEFLDTFTSRQEILDRWEQGFVCVMNALRALSADDLQKTIAIRGVPHTVPLAIQRSLGHTCYHIGQIVQAARVLAGENWSTLTIPRGQSQQFNQANWGTTGQSHS